MHACGSRFGGGDTRGRFRDRRIPTAGFGERNGQDRSIAMNHVEPEQQRNFQPRLFHGNALQFVRLLRAAHVERRAEQAFSCQVAMLRAKVSVTFAIELL